MAVLLVVGVLIVGGAATGLIVATGGKTKHESHQLVPSNGTGGPRTHDFPTDGPTSVPTDIASTGTGVETVAQAEIAENAETVLHAIADDDSAKFCPLIDPADLARLLKEKSLSSCSEIKLKSSADSAQYRSFTVEDPALIKVAGNVAHVPAVAIVPTSFGAVDMRRDADGNWKFRFYST